MMKIAILFLACVLAVCAEKQARGPYSNYKCSSIAGVWSTTTTPSNEGTSDFCTAGVGELVIYPNCYIKTAEFYVPADNSCGHYWRNGMINFQSKAGYGLLNTIGASDNSCDTNSNYNGNNADRTEVLKFVSSKMAYSNTYIEDGDDSGSMCAINTAYTKISGDLPAGPYDVCKGWST
eukprot:CAMPEP_0201475970 /NCGR_PEP_ID=MMETSP0151_2-20130828/1261_1 /ASSEMBLY_ACC=CAM_ASM_000257 /TAXON_ID=200890 /ORGANISM="Paramoeba atlantica, Strain 621/1 / CCAP 1560/9" /LENGTH=177 /DNA_ID=CAMNT_0047856191 /DNA_START=58 /DNA_END=591 /DNA_ORIENTATION=+